MRIERTTGPVAGEELRKSKETPVCTPLAINVTLNPPTLEEVDASRSSNVAKTRTHNHARYYIAFIYTLLSALLIYLDWNNPPIISSLLFTNLIFVLFSVDSKISKVAYVGFLTGLFGSYLFIAEELRLFAIMLISVGSLGAALVAYINVCLNRLQSEARLLKPVNRSELHRVADLIRHEDIRSYCHKIGNSRSLIRSELAAIANHAEAIMERQSDEQLKHFVYGIRLQPRPIVDRTMDKKALVYSDADGNVVLSEKALAFSEHAARGILDLLRGQKRSYTLIPYRINETDDSFEREEVVTTTTKHLAFHWQDKSMQSVTLSFHIDEQAAPVLPEQIEVGVNEVAVPDFVDAVLICQSIVEKVMENSEHDFQPEHY